MSFVHLRPPGAAGMRRLEAALAIWALLWFGVAALTAHELAALRSLSGTVAATGTAVATTGRALQRLGSVPFVGSEVRRIAGQARAAGRSAERSGRSSRTSVRNLSILLGIAIGLIPTVPLLLLFLPLRLAWGRERRELRAVLRDGVRPSLEEYLARRALESLPYGELRRLADDPWAALHDGGRRRLAEAELRRLGLRFPLDTPA